MKKFNKNILIFLASICVTLIIFAPTSFAKTDEGVKVTIKQGRYQGSSSNYTVYNVGNRDEFFNAMYDSINKIEDYVRIVPKDNYLNGDFSKFMDEFKKIVDIAGAGSYLDSYMVYSYTQNGKKAYEIEYKYSKGIEDARKKDDLVNKKVDLVINEIITNGMSEYEKEKAIHDYVVNNTSYDLENTEKDTLPVETHTPYGSLINGVAVCDGYASAVKKLMDKIGMECRIVTGEAGGVAHAWNVAKVDGLWRHLDATWDDPIVFQNGTRVEILLHDYFNKTDSFMMATHVWEKSYYPEVKENTSRPKIGSRYLDKKYKIN